MGSWMSKFQRVCILFLCTVHALHNLMEKRQESHSIWFKKSMPRIYLYPPSFTQGKLDPRWVNWAWVPYSRWYREGLTAGGFTGMPTRPQLNESWLRWESNEVLASFCPGNCDGRFYIYKRNNFCYCACHTGYSDTTVTQIGPSLAEKIDFKLAGIRNPGEIGVRIQTLAETLEI